MASTAKTDLALTLSVKEEEANDLGTARLTHLLQKLGFYGPGATAGLFDRVWSDTGSAAAAPVSIDVLGGLTSVLTGDAISFVTLCAVVVVNKSTTSTEILTIGGGANPVVDLWKTTGDAAEIGPSGVFVWFSPIDGCVPVAGTGDILTLDPGADTIAYDILLLGRSA